MADNKPKKKMGRPLKDFDKATFESLCEIQCTQVEIAHIFKCHIDTLCLWCKREYGETFSDTYKRFAAAGKVSMRRLQYKSAEGGNVPMQIWLGKQWLGQKDKAEGEEISKAVLDKLDDVLDNVKA